MPLRFDRHRPSQPIPSSTAGLPLRIVSLAAGLVLVVMLMQVARSPEAEHKLELLFGESATPPSSQQAGEQAGSPPLDYLPAVDRKLLATIEDNTTFRDEETAAWFHLLDVARHAELEQLQRASCGRLVYAQLLGQPQVYRGRVVEVAGYARRIETITPAANDLGIDRLYRVIIQPRSGITRPFTLYCLELPTGWAADSPPAENAVVDVIGLFFKNWVYDHQQGVDLSPVLLANSFAPRVAPATAPVARTMVPAWRVAALAAAIAVLVVAAIWLHSRRTTHVSRKRDDPAVAESLRTLQRETTNGALE